nr:MAG TPA: hypothetical protein [Caudoviricetes sp.]
MWIDIHYWRFLSFFKNIKFELVEIYPDHSLRFLYRLQCVRFATLPVMCHIDLNE